MIKTKNRIFTIEDVIENFSNKVDLETKNMSVLVKYLTDPKLATKIEGFKEDNKKLYFKIGGYWTRGGEKLNPAPKPDDILTNSSQLSQGELDDKLEYCGLRRFALEYIIMFFKALPSEKFKRRKCWRFNRWGTPVSSNAGTEHFPVRVVKRTTKFKKKVIEALEKEKAEWELAHQKLAEIQRTLMS